MNLMDALNEFNNRIYEIKEELPKISDETALTVPLLFPAWKADITYALDERIRYEEKLYRCVQPHTSQADWTPNATPALWTEVAKPGEIPVWKQPTGAQDAYNIGDRVWYPDRGDKVYESLIDANVFSPAGYPQGWMEVTE